MKSVGGFCLFVLQISEAKLKAQVSSFQFNTNFR